MKAKYALAAAVLWMGGLISSSSAQGQSLALPRPPRPYLQSFLNLKSDPQTLGMGGVYLAQGQEAGHSLWNPATLPNLSGVQTSLSFGRHASNHIKWSSFDIASRHWGFGLVALLDTNLPLPSFSASTTQQKSVDYGGIGKIAFAGSLHRLLNLGVMLKPTYIEWHKTTLATGAYRQRLWGGSVDVGLHAPISPHFGLGVVAQDLAGALEYQVLGKDNTVVETHWVGMPVRFSAGTQFAFSDGLNFALEAERLGDNPIYHLGSRWLFEKLPFSLWAGVYGNKDEFKNWKNLNWASGLGVQLWGQEINYAFLEEAGFSPSHVVGGSLNLTKPTGKAIATASRAKTEKQKPAPKEVTEVPQDQKKTDLTKPHEQKPGVPAWPPIISGATATGGKDGKTAPIGATPAFPENFYTYKSLFHSANDFALMASDLRVQIAQAQQDKILGFRETAKEWSAPKTEDDNSGLFLWQDWFDQFCSGVACCYLQSSSVKYSLIDMNNDSLPDYVLGDADATQKAFAKKGWTVFINNGQGFDVGSLWTWPDRAPNGVVHLAQGKYLEGEYIAGTTSAAFDVNNDGYPDYVMADYNNRVARQWQVALSQMPSSMSFGEFKTWNTSFDHAYLSRWYWPGENADPEFSELLCETFDITGDSIPDHICYDGISNNNECLWRVYRGYYDKQKGTGGFKPRETWKIDLSDKSKYLYPQDGWHRGAICRIGDGGIIHEVTKDMNGDNRPDHVFSTDKGYWYIAINNGAGFDKPKKWQTPFGKFAGFTNPETYNFISLFPQDYSCRHVVSSDLVDINGDGKADLVETATGMNGWIVWINNGNGFEPPKVFNTNESATYLHACSPSSGGYCNASRKYLWFIDVNNDKCPDLIDGQGGENGPWKVYINTAKGAEILANLTDAFTIRQIQAKLAEGHEAYFHEEYVLSLNAYAAADQLIRDFVGDDSAFVNQNIVSSARRLGRVPQNYAVTSILSQLHVGQATKISVQHAYKRKATSQTSGQTQVSGQELGKSSTQTTPGTTQGQVKFEGKVQYETKQGASEWVKFPVTASGKSWDVFCASDCAVVAYDDLYCKERISETALDNLILNQAICDDPQSFDLYLPYILDFVLPLCFGDVYLEMGNYAQAEAEYTRAAQDSCLNVPIEAKVLWLKFSELYLRWANELFKKSYRDADEDTLKKQAKALYQRVLDNNYPLFTVNTVKGDLQSSGCAALKDTMLQTVKGLGQATSGKTGLLADIKAIPIDPKVSPTQVEIAKMSLMNLNLSKKPIVDNLFVKRNPLVLYRQVEALNNVVKLENRLNYLGFSENVLPIWRYSYLSGLARSFVQHTIQLERESINFKVSAENETYTTKQLVQSIGLNKFNQLIEQYKVEQAAWQTAISKLNEKMAALQEEAARTRYESIKDQDNTWQIVGSVVSLAANVAAGVATAGTATAANDATTWESYLGYSAAGGQGIGGAISLIANSIAGDKQQAAEEEIARLQWEQAILAHQAAELQINIAQINQQISIVQRDMAKLQLAYARENLAYLQNKQFNAELWYKLASAVRELSRQYLDAAVELALLMEKAYNFETGRDMHKIRLDYTRNDLSGLLAGDYLLRDIDSFEYDRAVHIKEKDIPIKHVISLAATRPWQFFGFADSGKISFATTLEEFSRNYPGAYNCRIKEVELIFEGLLPPTGISGTLSNGCYSMVRMPMPEIVDKYKSSKDVQWRIHGAYYDTTKTHEMETMVLSKYTVREDRMVFTPPPEQAGIFENTGVATEWTLHLPMSANNLDFRTISDIKLVISFTAQYDPQLAKLIRCEYVADRKQHPENYKTLTMFSARYQFPDEFYHFINATEANVDTAKLQFSLNKYFFPRNEFEFEADSVYLVFFPPDSLSDSTFTATLLLKNDAGQDTSATGETDKSKKGIMRFNTSAFTDKTPLGDWVVQVTKQNFNKGQLSRLQDVWIFLNYKSKVNDFDCGKE